MTRMFVYRAVLAAFLATVAACGGAQAPSAPSVPAGPFRPPPSTFPAASGAARIYTFDHGLDYPVHLWTRDSRFVLYDNGAFVLQCGGPVGEYRGGYTEADGVVTFKWEGWSTAGPWGATGTISGDSLVVRYNEIMMLSDFEDAVYTRMP